MNLTSCINELNIIGNLISEYDSYIGGLNDVIEYLESIKEKHPEL